MYLRSRSEWGAGPNGRVDRGLLDSASLDGIAVHWPGGGKGLTGQSDAQIVKTLQTWQAQHRRQGWADIGYNFLIDGHGCVWEGCGWYRGAHAGTATGNRRRVGIQFITGDDEGPTAAQLAAFREFRTGVVLARAPRATDIDPHSHFTSTECPGDRIRGLINSGALASAPSGGDDMPLNADTDYAAFVTMLQRAFRYDLRPNGAGATHTLGPTIWERLNVLESNLGVKVAQGTSADPKAIAKQVVENLPDDIAEQVLDLLSSRIGGEK